MPNIPVSAAATGLPRFTRRAVGALIEQLIAMLDDMDGDADLEPDSDSEPGGDDEPSLGWRTSDDGVVCLGATADLEAVDYLPGQYAPRQTTPAGFIWFG